jgi:short-subunit dehydrogenase
LESELSYTLQDRKVLITGASAGIGLDAAKRFAREGANVWALARNRERLEELSKQEGGPPRMVPIVADVSDGPGMEETCNQILTKLGAPDVIVANAGIGLDATFENTSDEDLAHVFEVNVFGLVRTIRPFVRSMAERGDGRIILVSSVIGKRGIPNYSAYCGSKFALDGIAEALRSELFRSGVKVGVVYPSYTQTEFHSRLKRKGPGQKQKRLTRHSADSVARAIVRAARSGRRTIILSPEGKFLHYANRHIPGLLDRILAKVLVP